MKFWKMHGLGNDFVIFDARVEALPETAEWARAIADRRTGIGCDQIALIKPARDPRAYAYIRFLNADGTEPEASGNGTRLAVRRLLSELSTPHFFLETLRGLLEVDASDPNHIVVDMEAPRLSWQDIPLTHEIDTLHVPVKVDGFSGEGVCTNMGNPHVTFFVSDLDAVNISRVGPQVENYKLFPTRINAGFARMLGRDRLRLRMWERGTGHTLACGSGSCAAGVAAMRLGLAERRIIIETDIGELTVKWREDGHVLLGRTNRAGVYGRVLTSVAKAPKNSSA